MENTKALELVEDGYYIHLTTTQDKNGFCGSSYYKIKDGVVDFGIPTAVIDEYRQEKLVANLKAQLADAQAQLAALQSAVQEVRDFAFQEHNGFKVYFHGINDLLDKAIATRQPKEGA